MNQELDLFEFLKYIFNCEYISDLKTAPYNAKAKMLLNQMNLNKYPSKQIKGNRIYLYGL